MCPSMPRMWALHSCVFTLSFKLYPHRVSSVSGSGKVPLECIVTLQNWSQTHSQALRWAAPCGQWILTLPLSVFIPLFCHWKGIAETCKCFAINTTLTVLSMLVSKAIFLQYNSMWWFLVYESTAQLAELAWDWTRDWTQIASLAVSHSRRFSLLVSGCNWILFV